jgi:sugar lactone lactonase YvrE
MDLPRKSAALLLVFLAAACVAATPAFASNIGIVDRWDTGHPTGPTAIAASDDGHVYLVDGARGQVQKFTWSGQLVLTFGSFDAARGAAVDPAGNVYVTDRGNNNRVQKFSPSGQLLDTWGGFDGPSGVAVDPVGNVYVGDAHGIQKFDSGGGLLLRWSSMEPVGLAVGPDDRLYATASAFVHVYGPDGARLGHLLPRDPRVKYPDGEGLFDPGFGGAASLAVTRAGDIWAADPGNSRLQLFGADEKFQMACGRRGTDALRLVGNVAASGDQLFAGVVGEVVRLGPVARPAERCDDTAPRAERVALRPRAVRPAVAGKRIAVTMRLSESATLGIALSRHGSVLARRRISVRSGARRILLRRLTGRRTLPPGRYRLRMRLTDPSGNTARVGRALEFRVVEDHP